MKNKRKSGLKWILAVWFCSISATVDAQVTESLKAIGMENIRCAQTPGMTTVSLRTTYIEVPTPGGQSHRCLLGKQDEGRFAIGGTGKPDSQALHQSAGYIDGNIQKREINLTQVYQQMGITVDTDPAMKALKNAGQGKCRLPGRWIW